MKCAQCERPGTLTRTIRGAKVAFCDAVCAGDYIGWLKVPKEMDPWARGLNEVLNDIHSVHPFDQEACDFYEEWFRTITLVD